MSTDGELRDGIRSFLERACPIELVRSLQEPSTHGHCPELWRALADAGWVGMGLPEDVGGGGAGLSELGVFHAEAGRVLLPTGYATTGHAAMLVDTLGTDEQRGRWLPAIAAGELIASVAFTEFGAPYDWPHHDTTLTAGSALGGRKAFVPNASVADLLLVVARHDVGLAVIAVESARDGVTIDAQHTFARDNQAVVSLDGVRVTSDDVLGGADPTSTTELILRVQDTATALLAMEMAGGAGRVVEMTVAYAKERTQFGVPIGSFQAVHHHCADMATRTAGARLAAEHALELIAEGTPAQRAVSIAKSWADEAYTLVTQLAHQIHAGMGYVREHDLHLWSQRARAAAVQYGTADLHDERLAVTLLD